MGQVLLMSDSGVGWGWRAECLPAWLGKAERISAAACNLSVSTLPRCKKSNMKYGSLRWYCFAEERPGTCSTGRVYDLFFPLPAVECWPSQALLLPKELSLEWGDPAVRERRFQIWIFAPSSWTVLLGYFWDVWCAGVLCIAHAPQKAH